MVLIGKVAIVTGAAGGLGAEIARRYVAEGARVAVADIDEHGAGHVAAEFGESAFAVACDVTSRVSVNDLVDATLGKWGRIDIVVNNAGWTHRNQPMHQVSEADFDRVFDTNVKSIFHMTQAVLPTLRRQRGGVILNIGSVAGIRPRAGLSWYAASKGAVNSLSRAMAAELGPENIRVNAICPVLTPTGLFESFSGMPDTPENRRKLVSAIPLGRLAEPTDIAAAAAYLGSDDASFITGVEFPVDGGRTI